MAVGDTLKQAIADFDAGKIASAEEGLLQILPEHGPLFGKAQLYLGKIYQGQGNLPLAEQSFRTAARLLNQPDVIFQLSEFLFQQKRPDEAEPVLRRILSLDPKYTDAYIRLGMFQRDRQQISEAIRSFEQAIANDQRAVVARYLLAQLCLQAGNMQRSLSQLYFVLQLQPDYVPARTLQADLLQRMGDHRQALVELYQIVKLGRANATVFAKLGHSFEAIDDNKQAVKAYERAFALDRSMLPLAQHAATMREALGQPKKALQLYRVLAEHEAYQEEAQLGIQRMEQVLEQFNLGGASFSASVTVEPFEGPQDDDYEPPEYVSSGTTPLRPPATAPLPPSSSAPEKQEGVRGVMKGLNFFKRFSGSGDK